ncbi:MAG: ABC transporter permease [Acidobacteriota bacterium]
MRTLRIVKDCMRSLSRFKLRTGFMMVGPLIGVAALSFVVALGGAAVNKLLATVQQLFGASSIVVSSGGGFFMGGPRDATRLTIDDIEAVVRDVPGIDTWDPMVVVPDASVRRGDRNCLVRLMGQSERAERAWSRGAERGRFIDATDVAGSARVALIGETAARALFAEDYPDGQDIQIGSVPFRVVGILERFGTDIHGMDRDNEIVIPVTTAMRRVMNVDSIRAAKLLVTEPADVEAVTREVSLALRARHRLAQGQPDDFTVINSVAVRQMVGRIERVVFLYIPLVTATSLLAALAVAASLMLASVNERTAEIGLRRAVGARPADIRLQFLLETAATTLAGGIAGVILGGLVTALVAARISLSARLGPGAIALGLALSLLTGLLAGVTPARRAALLRPSDALR